MQVVRFRKFPSPYSVCGCAKGRPSRFGADLKDSPSRERVYLDAWSEILGLVCWDRGGAADRLERKLSKIVGVSTGETGPETTGSV